MKRLAILLISVLVHVSMLIPQAQGAEFRYSVAPLNIPLPAATPSNTWRGYSPISVSDINDNRQTVGSASYYDASRDDHSAAFFWEPGMAEATVRYPGDPDLYGFQINGINASGQMVVNEEIERGVYNVIRTEANFASPQILTTNHYNSGIAINNSGVVVGVGDWPNRKATIWESPTATPRTVPQLPGSLATLLPSRCFSINDLGQVIGIAYVQFFYPPTGQYYDKSTSFFYTMANGAMHELVAVDRDRYAIAHEVNNNGLVVGQSHKSGAYIYAEPLYWDAGGVPHAIRDKVPATFYDGYMMNIDDANNMYLSTSVKGSSAWVYNPAWTEAKSINDLIPADSGYQVGGVTTVSQGGLVICSANDAADNNVNLLLTPYDVLTSDVAAGSGASTTLGGGASQTGGVAATFSEVTGAGEMIAHYGNESTGDFALQFLTDPAAMDPVAGMVPGDNAQHWLVDFEGGTFTGPVTLTFCYDDTLLPPGFDENQLVLLHYTDGAWETLTPSAINTTLNTITFDTDSFSPFVLGTPVPEPCSAMILAISACGLLKRKRSGH